LYQINVKCESTAIPKTLKITGDGSVIQIIHGLLSAFHSNHNHISYLPVFLKYS